MEIDIDKLEAAYRNYGFEVKNEEDFICFLYRKGRYFGVDIVQIKFFSESPSKLETLQKKYSDIGYAINVKKYTSVDDIEKELFKSFFSYNATISRLKKKYSDFVAKQTKLLMGNQYEYIDSPFELYDGDTESGNGLLDTLNAVLKKTAPQLIIIEAAAGYGKTCAAYEILNKLINGNTETISPLFTELSKNRSAKIFRYILLDEVDLEFPTLSSDLVIHEIKNGRIPLIIDGFDELLDKVNVTNVDISSAFDDIETMLDTIGNLLEKNAKIILTSRKTAIFSGPEFDKWCEKWTNKFEVTRFSIKEPRIKDWIGIERFSIVKEKNVPIQYIANPVILTYLKNIHNEDFVNQIENPDILIKEYFDKMLERERERQNLIISIDKQYEIFKNVAKMLLDFDITVESKEFFKEIIKEQNNKLLEYTRTLYTGQDKPTIENLIDTLATHALLDRRGRDGYQIGFINDFVFGVLIGEIICESSIEKIEKDYSYYMLDLACTAYKVQNRKNKASLWNKIDSVRHKLQPISVFNYDVMLMEKLVRDYIGLSINDTTFFNIEFNEYTINNSVFINCYFKNCIFDTQIFLGVSFIECTFDNCSVTNQEYLDASKDISTIKSVLKDCQILENYNYHPVDSLTVFSEFEKEILKVIWKFSTTKSHHITILINSFEKNQTKQVSNSLNSLANNEFIRIRGGQISFNINKISIIKSELGL